MKTWLTVAEAARYADAGNGSAGLAHDAGSTTPRSGRPQTGCLQGRPADGS